jgi:hypothetical protein
MQRLQLVLVNVCLATLVTACGQQDKREVASRESRSSDSAMLAIRTYGARAVLDSLFRYPDVEEHYMEQIETMDSAWVAVAVQLKAVSDASLSESLDMALASALPKHPKRVLAILVEHPGLFSIDWVCSPPGFEQPDSVTTSYLRHTIPAVTGVQSPELAAVRKSCLQQLTANM